ncbi:MAG: ferritin-like domain-containing protein [Nocardioidaceae bacterium]|nr:ferritin-like domain-containing protein [Nocardioidaceae bacterium]
MFGNKTVVDMIDRSAENPADRRNFLRAAGVAGLGTVGAGLIGGAVASSASAAAPSDGAVLNFALNLEYLEAEFYSYAVHGRGLNSRLTTGTGERGGVVGGSKVPFKSKNLKRYAAEIAGDELAHVKFLRTALGGAKVSRPRIDLRTSFTNAALAAGLIKKGQKFNPFADEQSFLLGAYIFEDVGVTAYKGAAPLITNKTYLEAAAGILAVEAYHAGIIREALYERELFAPAAAISAARDSLDGPKDLDQGIRRRVAASTGRGDESSGRIVANLVPTDKNGIAYSRSPGQVLNIVYLNPASVSQGGFFPKGVNGAVTQSA